jgi:hypothetical protein
MHISVWKYIIRTVYLLHVSATHAAIAKKTYLEILQTFLNKCRCKILHLKKYAI